MFKFLLRFLIVLSLLLGTVSGVLHAQLVYDGVILGRTGKYDGYPTHLFVSGTHHIWWCSQGTYDEIWHATKVGSLGSGGWSTPTKAFGTGQSPWSLKHTCDPSILKGSFSYSGRSYGYVMYYTSIRSTGDNAIGAAFSNDGLIWKAHTSPVITPSAATTGYGAGMSGVAYKPGTSVIEHTYLDATLSPLLRVTEGTGGLAFSPLPGTATQLDFAGRNSGGQGPDIAYYPLDQHWYATIKNSDPQGIYDGEVRILRALDPNTLSGAWQVIGTINSSITGLTQNQNPGLAKNTDSTLYMDASGWAYVFFTVGLPRPDVSTWDIAQARFKPNPP